MTIFLSILFVLLVSYAGLTAIIVYLTIKDLGAKRPADFSDIYYLTPWELQVKYEDVFFNTTGKHKLHAWLLHPKKTKKTNVKKSAHQPVVVIFCGRFGRKQDYLGIASGLARQGFFVFVFEYRGRNEKDSIPVSVGHYERQDSRAAIKKVRQIFRERGQKPELFFLGYSLGGYLALACAADNKDVSAVASDCGFASLLDTIAYRYQRVYYWPRQLALFVLRICVQRIHHYDLRSIENYHAVAKKLSPKTALYFIHNRKDHSVPLSHSEHLFDAARGQRQLEITEQGAHCSTYFLDRSRYIKNINNFFVRHAKK